MTAPISPTIIRHPRGLARLIPEWRHLLERAPNRAASLTPEWCLSWLETFRDRRGPLAVITLHARGRLVGILPLCWAPPSLLAPRTLRFISADDTNGCSPFPEYSDLLHLPEWRSSCIDAVSALLADDVLLPWEVLDGGLGAPDSALAAARRSVPEGRVVEEEQVAPAADLSGGFESYLTRLSANSRQQCRRLLRQSERAGVRLRLARTTEERRSLLERLIELHQIRWHARGEPGAFTGRLHAYHHRLVEQLPSEECLLAGVGIDESEYAVLYGFSSGSRFEFYQSGMDPTAPLPRPGVLAHLLLMRELARRGFTEYDFMAGEAPYKLHLATHQRRLSRWQLIRPGMGAFLHASARALQRLTDRMPSWSA